MLPFVLLAAVGCVDPGEPSIVLEPSDELSEPVPDDAVFYETVVTIGPDGVHVDEPRAITAAAQRRQHDLRLAVERGEATPTPYIDRDYACSGASLWLFSRMDWIGDKICFKGCGSVPLSSVARYVNVGGTLYPIANWILSSGSYWPGGERGVLVSGSGSYGSSWIPFAAWGGKGRFNLGSLTIDGLGVGYTVQGEQCP